MPNRELEQLIDKLVEQHSLCAVLHALIEACYRRTSKNQLWSILGQGLTPIEGAADRLNL